MNHVQISCKVLSWLLSDQRWCSYAAREVGYATGVVDVLAVSSLLGQALTPDHEATYKVQSEAARQKLALIPPESRSYVKGDRHGWRRLHGQIYLDQYTDDQVPLVKRAGPPRVQVVEVKASVADLLADLRESKMHTYEPWVTHFCLAGPDEVIARAKADERVPGRWGLLVVEESRVRIERAPTRQRRGSPRMLIEALHRVLVSSSWRAAKLALPEFEPETEIA